MKTGVSGARGRFDFIKGRHPRRSANWNSRPAADDAHPLRGQGCSRGPGASQQGRVAIGDDGTPSHRKLHRYRFRPPRIRWVWLSALEGPGSTRRPLEVGALFCCNGPGSGGSFRFGGSRRLCPIFYFQPSLLDEVSDEMGAAEHWIPDDFFARRSLETEAYRQEGLSGAGRPPGRILRRRSSNGQPGLSTGSVRTAAASCNVRAGNRGQVRDRCGRPPSRPRVRPDRGAPGRTALRLADLSGTVGYSPFHFRPAFFHRGGPARSLVGLSSRCAACEKRAYTVVGTRQGSRRDRLPDRVLQSIAHDPAHPQRYGATPRASARADGGGPMRPPKSRVVGPHPTHPVPARPTVPLAAASGLGCRFEHPKQVAPLPGTSGPAGQPGAAPSASRTAANSPDQADRGVGSRMRRAATAAARVSGFVPSADRTDWPRKTGRVARGNTSGVDSARGVDPARTGAGQVGAGERSTVPRCRRSMAFGRQGTSATSAETPARPSGPRTGCSGRNSQSASHRPQSGRRVCRYRPRCPESGSADPFRA